MTKWRSILTYPYHEDSFPDVPDTIVDQTGCIDEFILLKGLWWVCTQRLDCYFHLFGKTRHDFRKKVCGRDLETLQWGVTWHSIWHTVQNVVLRSVSAKDFSNSTMHFRSGEYLNTLSTETLCYCSKNSSTKQTKSGIMQPPMTIWK